MGGAYSRQNGDISLAVGDGARRMTYAELADIRRISVASAMRLVRRKNWARQTGNDGVVRVLVPLPAAGDRKQRKALLRGASEADKSDIRRGQARTSDRTSAADNRRTIAALESALVTLGEQLADLQQRLDASDAERRAVQERLTAALTHRQVGSVPAVAPVSGPRVPWWRRWFR